MTYPATSAMPSESSAPTKPFLSFHHVTVRRFDKVVLSGIDWTVQTGENWAIIGPNGSGKTSLLEAILGKLPVTEGQIRYDFLEAGKQAGQIPDDYSFSRFIEFLSPHFTFRRRSNATDQYYQQRYHATDSEDFPTVLEFLMEASSFSREIIQAEPENQVEEWAEALKVSYLLNRRVSKLSNGESKRVRIIKALLNRPALLLLDNPFTGLDIQARQLLRESIHTIIQGGTQVLLVSDHDQIPDGITQVLQLREGKVAGNLDRKTYQQAKAHEEAILIKYPQPALNPVDLPAPAEAVYPFQTVVQLKNACVTYGNVRVLDQVSWTVKTGEKWALLGPNGSGKSTLLSLLTGDNPQAYANDIYLFDRKRGSGESIWDIKRKIGFVSPELQAFYPRSISCFEVVASGFFDTLVVNRPYTTEQAETVQSVLSLLQIESLANTVFAQASTGEQRLVLLARALVKNPPLLILDEPCQGLDHQNRERFKQAVEQVGKQTQQSLIYVTHYAEEIPNGVNRILRLEQGKVVEG